MNRIGILGFIAGAILLTACQKSSWIGGKVYQEDISSDDISRLLGAQTGKFKYTLPEGNYDTDIWLEQLDANTTEPELLVLLKNAAGTSSNGGTIWVSRTDPATTITEKNKVWKLVIVSENSIDGKSNNASASANYLLKNPLRDLPIKEQNGILASSKLDQRVIELGKEITLMQWAGGPPTESVRGGVTNFRHVYLKMKVVPHVTL